MTDNIMFVPSVILMVVEVAALVYLICAWHRDKRNKEDENGC